MLLKTIIGTALGMVLGTGICYVLIIHYYDRFLSFAMKKTLEHLEKEDEA